MAATLEVCFRKWCRPALQVVKGIRVIGTLKRVKRRMTAPHERRFTVFKDFRFRI